MLSCNARLVRPHPLLVHATALPEYLSNRSALIVNTKRPPSETLPTCPYHAPLFAFERPSPFMIADPLQRFLAMSGAMQPICLTENIRAGTALSSGCTCGRALGGMTKL
ncbi:hypothetical protein BDV96DRAFT_181804 [Lophiotrema nucula]|uniref:Uncharacterized protein n=1 Tax=Lophiotrema nucula TaxID=690887 RepID=A0A6A5YWB0_9PLEO|nr:hypothetical protein BDV96DRAFT_181804 [Lophiotrema nucula]